MSLNSKRKGKVGELELVRYLKSYGLECRRGQQFKGTPDSPDIVITHPFGEPDMHIECKRTEQLSVYKAMEQAQADAGEGKYQSYSIAAVANRGW